MDDFSNKLDKINTISAGIMFVAIVFVGLLAHVIPLKIPPYVPIVIIAMFFIPLMIGSIIFTIGFLIKMARRKNIYLIIGYTGLTFIIYTLADIYTSDLIYTSLGYNPKYVPHTQHIISFISLIYIGLSVTAMSMLAAGSLLMIASTIFNALINFCSYFINIQKLKLLNIKLSHIGFGNLFLAILFLFLNLFMDQYINFSKIIQIIAINADYYPINHSAYICKEARQYEAFNYLSNNLISVFRQDQLTNKPFLSIINCTTV